MGGGATAMSVHIYSLASKSFLFGWTKKESRRYSLISIYDDDDDDGLVYYRLVIVVVVFVSTVNLIKSLDRELARKLYPGDKFV